MSNEQQTNQDSSPVVTNSKSFRLFASCFRTSLHTVKGWDFCSSISAWSSIFAQIFRILRSSTNIKSTISLGDFNWSAIIVMDNQRSLCISFLTFSKLFLRSLRWMGNQVLNHLWPPHGHLWTFCVIQKLEQVTEIDSYRQPSTFWMSGLVFCRVSQWPPCFSVVCYSWFCREKNQVWNRFDLAVTRVMN